MNVLLVLLALGLLALGLSVYACLTAQEGYEDEEGFHAVKSQDELDARHPGTRDHKADDAAVPPFLSPQ